MSENNGNLGDSKSRSGELSLHSCLSNSNSNIRSGVLRPSVLSYSLNPAGSVGEVINKNEIAQLTSNPFTKEKHGDTRGDGTASSAIESGTAIAAENKDDDEPDERPDPLKLLSRNGLERSKLFSAARNSIPRVAKTGFVFGQNVHERVIRENISFDTTTTIGNQLHDESNMGCLLFSNVIENAAAEKPISSVDATAVDLKETDAKSLNEVARAYEESRAQKRKYEEVETFTGEENEVNIIDVSCKLYAFINSNWEERGRGSLRLNDAKNKTECSRVVFRTSGNLRLLVNTKVWAGMVADRHSPKSLRLTAMDSNGRIKIFLVMARPVDIIVLHKALAERISIRKNSCPEECGSEYFKEEKSGNESREKSQSEERN